MPPSSLRAPAASLGVELPGWQSQPGRPIECKQGAVFQQVGDLVRRHPDTLCSLLSAQPGRVHMLAGGPHSCFVALLRGPQIPLTGRFARHAGPLSLGLSTLRPQWVVMANRSITHGTAVHVPIREVH